MNTRQWLSRLGILLSIVLSIITMQMPTNTFGCQGPGGSGCSGSTAPAGSSSLTSESAFTPGDVNGGPVVVNTGGIGFSSIGQTISTLITFTIFLGAIIAFIFIVIGAFRYVSAGEDAAGTKAARTIITNAVVGLILLALTYVIFQIVIRVIPGLSQFFSPNQGG